MSVAGLAFDELNADQQKRLADILRQHPALQFITEGFPEGNISDRDLVMAAATWPDLARDHIKKVPGNPDALVIDDSAGYEETKPAVTEVKFDKKLHRGWHFIDTPLWVGQGSAPASLPPAPAVNAVGVVNVLVPQLKSNEPDPDKAYDFGWLLHLAGDLHQPLHAVAGYSEAFPTQQGDHGGNFVGLAKTPQGEDTTNGARELHEFWDNILGKSAARDKRTGRLRLEKDVDTANGIITDVQHLALGANSESTDPSTWASESFKLAARDGYNFHYEVTPIEIPKPHGPTEDMITTLTAEYDATAKKDAMQQVRRGGHRLALLLKEILH